MSLSVDPKILAVVAAGLAGSVARKTLSGVWKAVTGRPAPNDPEHPDTDLREAVAYAAISGVLIALARLAAARGAASLVAKKAAADA